MNPAERSSAELSPAEVVRRYLKVFETGDVAQMETLVAEDVEIWGAGNHVVGRRYPMGAAVTPGLTDCRMEIVELFEAGDRVVVYFHNTYRHEASGQDALQSGLKMYEVRDGKIVRFWGETDLYGLLMRLGKVPAEVSFE
ncbi:MAG: nuclear transport factor 2 family protein [Hamadaea sp.]|nr:nuclear transport factor 2 family protein [Hamadaea sp.]NUT06444.1 nuclear transport factor 2 family protein [Hamadaea sp.]